MFPKYLRSKDLSRLATLRQLVCTSLIYVLVCTSLVCTSFSKHYENDWLQDFLFFLFISLWTALVFEKCHIFTVIYTIFQKKKNILDETGKAFNIKFKPQWKVIFSVRFKFGIKSLSSMINFSIFLQISCSKFRLKLCQKP